MAHVSLVFRRFFPFFCHDAFEMPAYYRKYRAIRKVAKITSVGEIHISPFRYLHNGSFRRGETVFSPFSNKQKKRDKKDVGEF